MKKSVVIINTCSNSSKLDLLSAVAVKYFLACPKRIQLEFQLNKY